MHSTRSRYEFLLGIKTTIFLVGIVGGGAAAAGGSGILVLVEIKT